MLQCWRADCEILIHDGVLVTSNFDDDSIKNEWDSMETQFSHYKSMGIFLDLKGS